MGLLERGQVLPLGQVPVDLIAQARLRRRVDDAAVHVDVLDEPVHVRARAGEELEELAVGDGHRDVEVGDEG